MRTSSTAKANALDAQRRNRLRHPVKLHAIGKSGSAHSSFEGLLLNLSTGGFLLETGADLAFGESFELDLPGAEGLAARVAWDSAPLYGCEFVHPLDKSLVSQGRLKSESARTRTQEAPPIGSEIKRLRIAKGWTRADLAEKAGVSRPSVWGWETGKTKPRQEALRRLSDALGCCVSPSEPCSSLSSQLNRADGTHISSMNSHSDSESDVSIHEMVLTLRSAVASRLGIDKSKVKVGIDVGV